MVTESEVQVLVTGAAGYIGLHCAKALLDAGYRVRGTARTLDRKEALVAALEREGADASRFELLAADLTDDAGWPEALAGCRFVLHVASPFPAAAPKHEDDLLVPAREGTLRVLRHAVDAGVKRVAVTSSAAAVSGGHPERDAPFDEEDWTNLDGGVGAYEKSKTLAERAAWDFVASLPDEEPLELCTLNPTFVLGPPLAARGGTSVELVRRLLAGEVPGIADIYFPVIDVRDVARAHVVALRSEGAAGKRFVLDGGTVSLMDIAQVLKDPMAARGYRVTTRRVPSFVVRLVGLVDPAVRLVVPQLGRRTLLSNARMRSELGVEPRPFEGTLLDAAESLIEHGIV